MPGNYSKLVTVITGQTITAAERNNEFDNVINNMTPDGVDDASANAAAMQATADPSGASLATTLRGEIQRLRFQLLKLGSAGGNWYDALPFLAGITPVAAGATATDLNNRLAHIASQIKNLGGLTNWYDVVTAALLKAGGTMAGNIAMGTNKVTGLGAASTAGDALAYAQASGSLAGLTLTDNVSFNPTTKGIVGTATNDDAASGNVGQYISAAASGSNAPNSDQYGDLASISLPAGDWDVNCMVVWESNGATWTAGRYGISTTTGNSNAGLVNGSTQGIATFTGTNSNFLTISGSIETRLSLATTTTIYLKYFATYSSGTPQASGRISARRAR